MNGKELTTVDPMRLAWLLRTDLRRGDAANAPMSDWFKMWWTIHGVREYPAWANEIAPCDINLFKPQPDWPIYHGFGMTPALQFILATRNDLANQFDVRSESGLLGAISWFFAHGIREHSLSNMVDDATLSILDTTPPFYDDSTATVAPKLTWLMFFVWNASGDLQAHFNLQRVADRTAYIEWFLFEGVPNLELGALISNRWRDWLREPVMASPLSKKSIRRAGFLLWKRHAQLQRAFAISTQTGLYGLELWTEAAWHTEKTLAWIDKPAAVTNVQQPGAPKARPFGANLIGFAFGELGIGEDVRMAVAACEAAGIPFSVINISPGSHLRQADQALAEYVTTTDKQIEQAPYSINVFCLTAFDTARVALERGKSLFEGRYNIGWWPWELPVWPKDWAYVFGLVDEVWAATDFTYRMYKKATSLASPNPTSVNLMPMAVSVDRVKLITREEMDLPKGKFLFLYVFDFNSYLARKNPFDSIKAFHKAFPADDSSVGLVLKTMNSNPENLVWKEFMAACEMDSRIILIDRTLDRCEVLGLIQACDAYISLHRSEGFGRTLVEAMFFGKPVIATDFSGNTDFLNEKTGFPVPWVRKSVQTHEYPFVTQEDNAWWAAPQLPAAAQSMRLARSCAPSASSLSMVRQKFCPANIGAAIQARFNELASEYLSQTLSPTVDI